MPYLVDGNNLLGFLSGKPGRSEEDRRRLIRIVADRLRTRRARVALVFDGPPPAGNAESSLGSLSVRYAASRSADDVIAEAASRDAAPADLRVVTDDRGLRDRVRAAGARVLSAAEFWGRFAEGGPTGAGEKAVDVSEWLDFFADDRNRLS